MFRRRSVWCLVALAAWSVVVLLPASAMATSAGSIIDAVNAARAERGLAQLQHYGDDTKAVEANEHFITTGQGHGTVAAASQWYFDRGADGFRENQAIIPDGVASGASVVDSWRASQQHADNLYAADVTHIAAAVRSSGGRTYYTVHILAHGSVPPPGSSSSDGGGGSEAGGGRSEASEDPPEPEPEPEPEPVPDPEPAPGPEPAPDPELAAEREPELEPEPAPEPAPAGESEPDPALPEEEVTEPGAPPERDLSALRAPVSDVVAEDPDEEADSAVELSGQDPRSDVEVAPLVFTAPEEPPVAVDAAALAAGVDEPPLEGLVPGAVLLLFLTVAAVAGRAEQRR